MAKIRIVVGDDDPSANTVEIDGKQHQRVVALGFHAEPKDVVTLVVDELPPAGHPGRHISTEYVIGRFELEAETLT